MMSKAWKKGRGKLGFMQPLLGQWIATAETPMGPVRCTRAFELFGGSYVRLDARWEFGAGSAKTLDECPETPLQGGRVYKEVALIGAGDGGKVCFWSFTSDGKRSQGSVADVSDIHKEAIGFEARMPAGLARMAYWPDGEDGFFWVVEAKNARGWKRFTEHHYRPAT
jgi:hypothetical protein